jgi:hypothetical protein
MRIRRILTTTAVVGALLVGGQSRPATAVDADFVACQGSITSATRTFADVTGTGPATCVFTIGGGLPATATATVYVDVAETSCSPLGPTGGAAITVTVGPNTYTFVYLAAGALGSEAGAEQQARRNSEPGEIMAGGVLTWIDGPELSRCLGQPAAGGITQYPEFAFTGFYGPQPVPGV